MLSTAWSPCASAAAWGPRGSSSASELAQSLLTASVGFLPNEQTALHFRLPQTNRIALGIFHPCERSYVLFGSLTACALPPPALTVLPASHPWTPILRWS